MEEAEKTGGPLLEEVEQLRKRVAALEASEAEHRRVKQKLRARMESAQSLLEAIPEAMVVIDRHFSPGGPGGPVAQEIKHVLYGTDQSIPIVECVAGLGGRDIFFGDFDNMYDKGKAVLGGAPVPPFELIQARGGHYGEV